MNSKYQMLTPIQSFFTGCLLIIGLWSNVIAHEGHSHDKEAKPVHIVNSSPTLTAISENYELVGVVQSGQMIIFLDQFESNTPVVDADLEFDFSGIVLKATRNPNGTYLVDLPKSFDPKMSIPVTVTVLASSGPDLLSGELISTNLVSQSNPSIILILLILSGLLVATVCAWLLIRLNPSMVVSIKTKISSFVRRYRK